LTLGASDDRLLLDALSETNPLLTGDELSAMQLVAIAIGTKNIKKTFKLSFIYSLQ
jgi:hypothetical protein